MKKVKRQSGEGMKAASASTPEEPPPSPAVPSPPLEWEERAEFLGPILRYNSLPLVVMCDRNGLPPSERVNFDFTQPLFLHNRRTVRKVVASSVMQVQHEGSTRLKEVGDQLLIPEDYKGWFAVLGPPEDVKPEKVVPYFRQVAQLALSKCESFLIGGNEPVSAVQMSSYREGGDNQAQPRLVYPGDVLRMGKLYVGESTVKVKKPKLFGGKKMVKKEEKFLMCTDDNDRELYLPVENKGTFYMLTTEGRGTPKIPIMRMPDICAHFRFPCVVKLLFGRMPPTPCSFTGMLVLRESHIESSVIGCTLLNLRNIFLDIPIDSDLKFFMAENTTDLLSSRAYKNAKALCQEKAGTYMRNMKVAYYVSEEERHFPDEVQEERTSEGHVSSPSSERSNSISSMQVMTSVLPCRRPSIVEDQALFCPPDTRAKVSVTSPSTPGQKKAKQSIPGAETATPIDSRAYDSPTVLRKDETFNLPKTAEAMPLKTAKSLPSLGAKRRPLPPVVPPPDPDSLSNSNYITMNEAKDKWSFPQDLRPEDFNSSTPPVPPPKPHKTLLPGDGQSDSNPYTQIWNGRNKSSCVKKRDGEYETHYQSPRLRPKRVNAVPEVHRISSIAFSDTYLTLPMLKETNGSPEKPSMISKANSTTALPSAAGGDSSTHSRAAAVDKTSSSVPTSTCVPRSTGSEVEQEYETMSNLSKPVDDTYTLASSDEQKPPTPPPKVRQLSRSSDGNVSRTKPLPPLPVPEPSCPGIVFENSSSTFSDSSCVQSSYSSHCQDTSSSSDHTCVRSRQTSYTYYDGCEEKRGNVDDKDDGQAELFVSDAEEVLYQNIHNLRLCPEKALDADRCPSDNSTGLHGGFLDKLANPASVFGYVSPTSTRRSPRNQSQGHTNQFTVDKDVDQGQTVNLDTNHESNYSESGKLKFQLPPKPCGTGNTAKAGYLHACTAADSSQNFGYIHACENSDKSSPPAQARIRSGFSDASFHTDVEDDLPIGATFATFRQTKSDSGCHLESEAGSDCELSSLSVADVCDALKNVGLMKETVETLRREKVDGRLLASLEEEELKEALPGVKKLDIKKIRMFANGWRPLE